MRLLGTIPDLFYKKILHTKKRIKYKQATFIQMLLYTQKALKSKQATFTHKEHKKQTSNSS